MYSLVHRHPDFYVIDKAPGANLHRNDRGRSVLDALADDYPCESSLHLVHRLDDATSGLLLIARNPVAAAHLAELFRNRKIEKYYIALADGRPRKKQGSVVGDIEKSRGGSYRLSRSRNNPSKTRFISTSVAAGRRCYLLKPITGKTHQLRVVMASLGAAILGDTRYGKVAADRCYLHAWALRFDYQGETLSFVCPPSSGEGFADRAVASALLEWAPPWGLPWGASSKPATI